MSGGVDESTKELTEKLKKAMKSHDWPGSVTTDIANTYGLQLPASLMQQLSKSNTNTVDRLAAVRQLTQTTKIKIIQEEQVEHLWLAMSDLLTEESTPPSARHTAMALLTAVAVSSSSSKRFGAPMRHIIFNYVSDRSKTDQAIEPLFDLLSGALSKGKTLELVEDLVGPFYNSWYPKLLQSDRSEASIELFVNLTKTNAAYLDEPELLGLVKQTVVHMNSTMSEREGVLCLTAIETVVAYSHLPSVMLFSVVASLARVVGVPSQTERAWKLMRSILGTYMGVSALFTLVDIIKSTEVKDPHITRGCVYFLHTALWGPQSPIAALDTSYSIAVPVMVQASEHENELVVYEVSFAMKLLVGKKGSDLYPLAWENVFRTLTNIYKYAISMTDSVKAQAILNVVSDTVDYIEQLRDRDVLRVLRESFYTFLTPFTLLRTETSTLHVLNFLAKDAVANCSEEGWLQKLSVVLVQYYCKDPRIVIRIQATKWMVDCHKALGKKQGTQLLEQIVLPCVRDYRKEPLAVRCAVVDVLGYIVYQHNHPLIAECLEMLLQTILEPFKQSLDSGLHKRPAEEVEDVSKAIDWLILIFKRRMWDLPSSDAIVAFRSLLTFLENHYTQPQLFLSLCKSRAKIFEMIFQIRANHRYEIGLPEVEDAHIQFGMPEIPGQDPSVLPLYTPYIIIDHKHGLTLAGAASTSPYLSRNSPYQFRTSVEKIRLAATPTDTAAILGTTPSAGDTPAPGVGVTPTTTYGTMDATSTPSTLTGSAPTTGTTVTTEPPPNITTTAPSSCSSTSDPSTCVSISTATASSVSTHGTDAAAANSIASLSLLEEPKEDVVSPGPCSDSTNNKKPTSQSPDETIGGGGGTAVIASAGTSAADKDSSNADPILSEASSTAAISSTNPVMKSSTLMLDNPQQSHQEQKALKIKILKESLSAMDKHQFSLGCNVDPLPTTLCAPQMPESDDPWRQAQGHSTITYLSLTEAAATVIIAMKKEKDWEILKIILEGIPKMLQNKALIVSRDSNDIDYFAEALTGVISDRTLDLPASLYNTPDKFLRPDFEQFVFLALSCLSCYRQQLSVKWQNSMVSCLTGGMSRNSGGVCIAALTLCCLEMPQTMVKSLPTILHQLTRTSATVHSSQPVLEFLSTLLHLPHIYSFFSSDQYMAVFAIVIPYTNPIKFSQYVVILAFHVLAMWFLKCKLDSRRNFVKFITKNLRNVLGPEDMQPRRRSASLNDQGVSGDRTEVFAKLHKDMRMTLLDLMSRYTFASCTPMARRSEVGEALVGSGQQQTWLVGLKLFTITTSGCSQRPMTKDGLCENCHAACQELMRKRGKKVTGDNSEDKSRRASEELSESAAGTSSGASKSVTTEDGQKDCSGGTAGQAATTSSSIDGLTGTSAQQAVRDNHLCTCWCIGYSEVYVRQPTGNMVWMMRLQNHQQILEEGKQLTLDDLASLYGPGTTPRPAHLPQDTSLNSSAAPDSGDPQQLRRRSSGRRGSDGSFLLLAGGVGGGKPAGGSLLVRRGSVAGGRMASTSPEAVRHASDGAVGSGAAAALTGSIIGGGSRATSVDEESSADERIAVQRSQSNPEIGDGDAPLTRRHPSAVATRTAAATSADAAANIQGSAQQQPPVDPRLSLASDIFFDTMSPATINTSNSSVFTFTTTAQQQTADNADTSSSTRGVSTSTTAAAGGRTHSSSNSIVSPLGRTSTSSSNAGYNTAVVSPSVPASPSKLFSRLGNKFNSNINKFFGSPSMSSSPGGVTSPGGGGNSGAAPVDHGDSKRLRHSSALSPSNSHFGPLNVSALTGGSQTLQKTHGSHDGEDGDAVPPMRRGRGHTISITNPASRPPPPLAGVSSPPPTHLSSSPHIASPPQPTQPRLQELFGKPWSRPQPGATTSRDPRKRGDKRGGVTPSNVLLQLLYAGNLDKSFERPLLIPMEQEEFKRSIDVLDHTPPLENHKIGVLYVGPGQKTEQEILGNRIGSTRYNNFLRDLGTVVNVKKAAKGTFLPGLSDTGDDGDECYVWQDEIMQVGFHVATVMPNKPNDPKFVFKKRHIGNDSVTIVYNDSGAPYDRDTIKTQFNTVIVEIRPAEHETNTVYLLLKPQIRDLLTTTPVVRLVSDTNIALYARQMALHAVIACRVQLQLNHPEPYAGNWLSRLRTTYRLRQRLLDRLAQLDDDETTDFTDMI